MATKKNGAASRTAKKVTAPKKVVKTARKSK
jgi:hypothetical protein